MTSKSQEPLKQQLEKFNSSHNQVVLGTMKRWVDSNGLEAGKNLTPSCYAKGRLRRRKRMMRAPGQDLFDALERMQQEVWDQWGQGAAMFRCAIPEQGKPKHWRRIKR